MPRKAIPEKVNEVKEKIVCAAVDLILEVGFTKFTLLNVAKKVGITKASIYWYFDSKEALLNALALSIKNSFFTLTEQIAKQPITPKQKISLLIESLEDSTMHRRCFLVVKVFIELYSADDNIKRIIQGGYNEYIEMIQEIFKEGIQNGEIKANFDKTSLARMFCAMLDGCVIHDELIGKMNYADIRSFYLFALFSEG